MSLHSIQQEFVTLMEKGEVGNFGVSTIKLFSNLITKPSALVTVPFDLGMPQTPENVYVALARAMVIQVLDTVLVSPVSH